MQVLSTFCVLINLNNPIDTLRSRLYYLSYFVDIFVVLQANYTIIIESTKIRRTQAELEAACTSQKAIGAKNIRRDEHCRDFAVL